jgi:hypothetical protein
MPVATKWVMIAAKVVPMANREPAESLPEFTKAGSLSEDIRNVSCAVGDVRYHRQQEKAQTEIQGECCFGRGISGCEVDDYDGCERQFVEEPPTFPEFDGVSDVVPKVRWVHGNECNLVEVPRFHFTLRSMSEQLPSIRPSPGYAGSHPADSQ